MLVGHGQKIFDKVEATQQEVHDTRRDVIETKADTTLILDLLTPQSEEPDPVIEALDRIEELMSRGFSEINRRLTKIEQQLDALRE